MSAYKPGLHILSTFYAPPDSLCNMEGCRQLFDELISGLELTKVGEVYHSFPGAGFTAAICLTESHASIHTWPEYGLATFDIFLSNYRNDNQEKAHAFHQATLSFFQGTDETVTILKR